MNDVFIDTWAWFALTDHTSSEHELALLAMEDLRERQVSLLTTNFVLDEATTLIRYKLHHATAVAFRRMIRQLIADSLLQVVRITEAHEEEAGKVFEGYDDADLSFTDCASFTVMRELGLTEVFTGDEHFRMMGFVLIP
jgi:hypothetical protein